MQYVGGDDDVIATFLQALFAGQGRRVENRCVEIRRVRVKRLTSVDQERFRQIREEIGFDMLDIGREPRKDFARGAARARANLCDAQTLAGVGGNVRLDRRFQRVAQDVVKVVGDDAAIVDTAHEIESAFGKNHIRGRSVACEDLWQCPQRGIHQRNVIL